MEELQTSYGPAWGGSLDRDAPTVVAVHAYHNLAIIEKGRNREGTNKHVAADASG